VFVTLKDSVNPYNLKYPSFLTPEREQDQIGAMTGTGVAINYATF